MDKYEDEEELEDEYLELEDPSATEMPIDGEVSDTRQMIDETLDDAGSQIVQQMGVPKPLADKAIETGGGKFSPNNLPAAKAGKEKARNTLANGIDKLANLKNGKGGSVPKGLTQNKGPQNQAKQNANNRANDEKKEEGQGSKLGQSGQKGQKKEKSAVDQAAEKVVSKGLSAAAQAYGVPAPIADALSDKLAGPLLEMQKKQQKIQLAIMIGSAVGSFLLLGFFICLIAAIFDFGDSNTTSKNDYLYGTGTAESLYEYLVDEGYCETVSSCEGSPAANFYEELKVVIDGNSNLTELEADVFITEFIFYDRNNSEKFDGTIEEITYIASIIGASGVFDINDTDKYKTSFIGDNGYFETYRSDLLEKFDTDSFQTKIYDKVVKSAQKESKAQVKEKNKSTELIEGYYVNGKVVSDVKVRLLQCSDGKVGEPIEGEELLEFEKYVTGVVYAENEGAPEEALKAQAIAARTYSLLRGDNMGNKYNLGLTQENGQWILSIRNCTEDQVYCDPDKGCWSDSETAGSTVHSGYDSTKSFSKPVLAADSVIRTAVAETASSVLVGANGKMINTPYSDTTQTTWNTSANSGKDHFEILKASYPTASRILTVGPTITGTFTQWKQCGESWSGIRLGKSSSNICDAGCYITSIAIQMARSGTKVNVPEFNPGVLVNHLSSQNAFSDGGSLQSFSWQALAPSFKYYTNITLSGTEAEKAATIKSYQDQGLYVIIRARTNQHWVALDKVVGSTVYMFDPATSATKLWDKYPANDVTRITVFKNG